MGRIYAWNHIDQKFLYNDDDKKMPRAYVSIELVGTSERDMFEKPG